MSNPGGSFGGKGKIRRNPSMKLQPLPDDATARQPFTMRDLPLECCGKCISWHLEAAQQQDNFSPPVAACRRFPGSVVVIPVPMDAAEIDKLRLHPQFGPSIRAGQIPTKQTPVPMTIVKSADDWCREYEPRPMPPISEDAPADDERK